MDFAQTLDNGKLLLFDAALAFICSPFNGPPYNLPLVLFGFYVFESEVVQSLQCFLVLFSTSVIFDIVWMAKNDQNGFIRFLTIALLIMKIPTSIAFVGTLRQRGAQFRGLASGDISGPTVWSMPGGFTSNSREGYQSVDEEEAQYSGPPKPPAQPPAQPANTHSAQPAPQQGAYQSV